MNRNFLAALLGGALLALSGCASIGDWKMFRLSTDEEIADEDAALVSTAIARLHEPMHRGFLDAEAEGRRVRAAWNLGHDFKAYSAIPDLAQALSDDDPDVRLNATMSLKEMADHAQSAIPALKGALKDSWGWVRIIAASALWSMDVDPAELIPVLDGVTTGPNLHDAVEAADLAITFGQEPRELIPVLLRGMREELGEQAGTVLRNLEGSQLQRQDIAYLPILLEGARSSAPGIRGSSVHLLGTPVYASPAVTKIIRDAVWDSSEHVRMEATSSLVHGGDGHDEVGDLLGADQGTGDETLALLVNLAVLKWHPDVRRIALEDLGETKSTAPAAMAALIAGLKDGNKEVRQQAAESLELMGTRAEPAKATLLAIWTEGKRVAHAKGEDDFDLDDTFYYQPIGEALQHMGVDPPD